MAKEDVDEALKELKAKLEEKAEELKPASQPDPASADEDQRKLFVGGLAQVRGSCFLFHVHKFSAVYSSGCQGY